MVRIDSKLFENKGFTFLKLKLFKFYAKNTSINSILIDFSFHG